MPRSRKKGITDAAGKLAGDVKSEAEGKADSCRQGAESHWRGEGHTSRLLLPVSPLRLSATVFNSAQTPPATQPNLRNPGLVQRPGWETLAGSAVMRIACG